MTTTTTRPGLPRLLHSALLAVLGAIFELRRGGAMVAGVASCAPASSSWSKPWPHERAPPAPVDSKIFASKARSSGGFITNQCSQ